MAFQVETKAHADKPFYAAAVRLALIGADSNAERMLSSLAPFLSLYQHGGRPLHHINHRDYSSHLSPEMVPKMFMMGLTFRPGFLVQSWELSGLTATVRGIASSARA